MSRYSAVFDVGKTNKKVLILNDQLETVASAYENFPADESQPIHIEQFAEARDWMFARLKEFAQQYHIDAISVTTHGATVVFIDEAGDFTIPPIAYTSSIPQDCYDNFYKEFGSQRELHKKVATPFLGSLLNYALCVYYAKGAYPEAYAATKDILTLPSYFVHALTGIAGADPTSVGCHSYFWDFEKKTWSFVAEKMGILDKLPKTINDSHEVIGVVKESLVKELGLPADCKVTYGVHDSNSSLIPYLAHSKEAFLLNSTGTWCVSMCTNDEMSFTEEEMDAGAFYNVSALGLPVKTAIFMGGNEHDVWAKALQEQAGLDGFPAFDPALYQRVISEQSAFILPGVIDTGPFPHSISRVHENGTDYLLKDIQAGSVKPACFADSAYAYAVLNLSLALHSVANFKNVGLEDGMTIYIEGGFRKNDAYHALLAALCPQNHVVLSNLQEATAFGAALMNIAAVEGKSLNDIGDKFTIDTTDIEKRHFDALDAYQEKFLALVKA